MFCRIESLETRLLFAVTPAVARPAFNTGEGFFVSGGEVFDANGIPFDIRGFNHTTWWGNEANNLAAIDEFSKTNANAVRAVFGTGFGGSQTPAQRKAIVERYIDNDIVPIVEDHMATCDTEPDDLLAVVDRWLEPDNVQWLRQYEREIILNIANEWGPDAPLYRDTYTTAITRLRDAGVNAMLMIDAGGCGQNIHTLQTWAQDLLDHDPEHNIVFSIHMYNMWRTEGGTDVGSGNPAIGSPWDVATELQAIKDAGLPIVVGEFSWDGTSFVGYDTERAVKIFDDLDIGWLAWSWNQNSDPLLDMVAGGDRWQYNSDADLTTFGKFIINDPEVGLKATAVPASIWSPIVAPPSEIRLEQDSYQDREGRSAEVTVRRFGSTDAEVEVGYTTLDGTATGTQDYTPQSGRVVFSPGETIKTISIPLIADGFSDEGIERFTLRLTDVTGPSVVLGSPADAEIRILDIDSRPPTITNVSLSSTGERVTAISLVFSEPMNADAVTDASNYLLYDRGKDGRLPQKNVKPISVAQADYDPATRTVTLLPEKKLKFNKLYEVFTQSTRITGVDGNQLDGGGHAGDPFRQFVGRGQKFKYVDEDNDIVNLRINDGGPMDLFRSLNGQGELLSVLDAEPGTYLTGNVKKQGSGDTYIARITGLAEEQIRLDPSMFRYNDLV